MPGASEYPGSVILAGKCSCSLSECSNHIISEIFKIHGNRTARNRIRFKAVYRSLYKYIGKAEYRSLNSRRNTDIKNWQNEAGADIAFKRR